MTEKIDYWLLTILAGVGAAIGIGKLLESGEPLKPRKAIGRAIVSGGLAAAGSLILIPYPDLPLPVVVGAGAALSSLGVSYLENLLARKLEKK